MARDTGLIKKRNENILRRYYYWTEVERLRFDDALRILSEEEFFISQGLILKIIRENCDKVKDMGAKQVKRVRAPRISAEQMRKLRIKN